VTNAAESSIILKVDYCIKIHFLININISSDILLRKTFRFITILKYTFDQKDYTKKQKQHKKKKKIIILRLNPKRRIIFDGKQLADNSLYDNRV